MKNVNNETVSYQLPMTIEQRLGLKKTNWKPNIPMNIQLFAEGDDDDGGGDDGGDPKPFDPALMTPEMSAWVDSQRTAASKTAAKNAKAKLEADETFIEGLRLKIEKENNLTVEEKLALRQQELDERESATLLRENKTTAVDSLIEHGLIKADADAIADILSTSDIEQTTANIITFASLFDTALTTATEKVKQDLLKNGYKPQMNADGNKGYEAQLKEARAKNDTLAVVRIKREAFEKEKLVLN